MINRRHSWWQQHPSGSAMYDNALCFTLLVFSLSCSTEGNLWWPLLTQCYDLAKSSLLGRPLTQIFKPQDRILATTMAHGALSLYMWSSSFLAKSQNLTIAIKLWPRHQPSHLFFSYLNSYIISFLMHKHTIAMP